MTDKNKLYYGDNLAVLREHVKDESVDLIYLDPPFNSNASYNVLFKEHDGAAAASQIKAFEDTWRWDETAALAYQETVEAGGKLSEALQAFRKLIGESDMLAYLSMMAPRLRELWRVLKPTGSIYLHCDPTASHFLKLLLDSTFGPQHFRSEIIWRRQNAKGLAFKGYPNNHDTLLYYMKLEGPIWNRPYKAHDPEYVEKFYRYVEEETGRRYRVSDLTNPNTNRPNLTYEWNGHRRVWRWTRKRMQESEKKGLIHYSSTGFASQKRYLDEMQGVAVDTIWDDIKPIQAHAAERLGYPTQKPLALLERIVSASSRAGDLVLDPFCGCGTTIDAAQKLERRWIGVDITHLAINLIRHRLQDTYGESINKTYEVIGEPVSVPDARVLAAQDPYQFQWWALGLVGARPVVQKKGADKGIDGRIYFHEGDAAETKQVILSVKAGKLTPAYVRDLVGVVQREEAQMGVLISMHSPTKSMRAEAASAGFYESRWGRYQKIQILTVADLLAGTRIAMPAVTGMNVTFKKARRREANGGDQLIIREETAEYTS